MSTRWRRFFPLWPLLFACVAAAEGPMSVDVEATRTIETKIGSCSLAPAAELQDLASPSSSLRHLSSEAGLVRNVGGTDLGSTTLPPMGSSSGSSTPNIMKMSLEDCVALAVRRNTAIKVAYMDRVLAKYNFITQHGYAFRPSISLSTTAGRSGSWQATTRESGTSNDQVSTNISVGQRLPTGGTIQISANPWSRSRSRSQTDFEDPVTGWSIDRSWNISLSQPLLRGAGSNYGTADRRLTQLSEAQNVLNLKETVQGEVTSVIKAYRTLLQTKWSREINAGALDRARQQLEMNRVLIDMGRMPKMELIQSESDVANRELSYQLAVNSYDQARIALLKLLDLDVETLIEPDETLELPSFDLDEESVLKLIHKNQPNYLSTLLSLEQVRINLMKARSDRKWGLNLAGSFERGRNDVMPGDATKKESWQMGLSLEVPVYGSQKRSSISAVMGAENELQKALIKLRKLEDDLKLEVRDTIRQIRTYMRQIELAVKAREFSEKKLDVELEKLKAGKTTNFQLVTFQDELRNLKITEMTARITYLNALTDLERTMGITLEKWGIELNADRPKTGPVSRRMATGTTLLKDRPESQELSR